MLDIVFHLFLSSQNGYEIIGGIGRGNIAGLGHERAVHFNHHKATRLTSSHPHIERFILLVVDCDIQLSICSKFVTPDQMGAERLWVLSHIKDRLIIRGPGQICLNIFYAVINQLTGF